MRDRLADISHNAAMQDQYMLVLVSPRGNHATAAVSHPEDLAQHGEVARVYVHELLKRVDEQD